MKAGRACQHAAQEDAGQASVAAAWQHVQGFEASKSSATALGPNLRLRGSGYQAPRHHHLRPGASLRCSVEPLAPACSAQRWGRGRLRAGYYYLGGCCGGLCSCRVQVVSVADAAVTVVHQYRYIV